MIFRSYYSKNFNLKKFNNSDIVIIKKIFKQIKFINRKLFVLKASILNNIFTIIKIKLEIFN